jgi:hypothetical protein
MSNRYRLCMGAATTAAVCAIAGAGAALAGTSGYTINKIAVPKSVKREPVGSAKTFRITVKWSAKTKSALWVFLDHKTCLSSETKEGERDGVYHLGYSYFTGPSTVVEVEDKGSATSSFSAHPGSKVGRRYVCAYVTATGTKAGTKAFKSTTYQVTK